MIFKGKENENTFTGMSEFIFLATKKTFNTETLILSVLAFPH